jgi:predicted dehydrogenase
VYSRPHAPTDLAIGLAGAGYWGAKLARNVFEVPGGRLAMVCDVDPARRDAIAGRYPGCRAAPDFNALIVQPELDAIVLATPAAVHAEQARAALEAGKHVLVEKPLALSRLECEELTEHAAARGLTLMVGHTFLYSESVRALRRLVVEGELGQVLYVYGQRVNLGVVREDLSALWDLGPHDVSILLYLLGEVPVRVSARQFSILNRPLEDVAFMLLEFASGGMGHIHVSCLDPRKVRQFKVVGDRKMAIYDDTQADAPLRIVEKGIARNGSDTAAGVAAGDVMPPRIVRHEPLHTEVEHFISCVKSSRPPFTDGRHAGEVVAVLEAAQQSSDEDGRAVTLERLSPAP